MLRRQLIAYPAAALVALASATYAYRSVRPVVVAAAHVAGQIAAGFHHRQPARRPIHATAVVVSLPLVRAVAADTLIVVRHLGERGAANGPAERSHRAGAPLPCTAS